MQFKQNLHLVPYSTGNILTKMLNDMERQKDSEESIQ